MSTAANPRADNPQQGGQEATGAVASDSLAAESMNQGGGFSENDNAHVMGVKGSNSTLNTTDTSGATTLHAASDGAMREKQDAMGHGADEKGVTGLKYPEAAGQPSFDGAVSSEGYAGAPSNSSSGPNTTTGGTSSGATGDSFADGGAGLSGSSGPKASEISSGSAALNQASGQTGTTSSGNGGSGASGNTSGGTTSSGNTSGGNTSGGTTSSGTTSSGNTGGGNASSGNRGDNPLVTGNAGEDFGEAHQPGKNTAPNYAGTVSGAIQSEGQNKPKGANLTEGGDVPETGTFTGNVGGQYDPGRVAENKMLKTDAIDTVSAGQPGHGGSGQDSRTGGAFDALRTERAP